MDSGRPSKLYISYMLCLCFAFHVDAIYQSTCFSCNEVTSLADCDTLRKCDFEEVCFTSTKKDENGLLLYSSGCRQLAKCPISSQSSIFNRFYGTLRRHRLLSVAADGSCSECCTGDLCNKKLCQLGDLSRQPTRTIGGEIQKLDSHLPTWLQSLSRSSERSGLKCYSCDVNLHEECLTSVTCLRDEVCYADVTKDDSGVLYFHSGCQKDCREFTVDDNIHQCCENNLCNNRIRVPAEHIARSPSDVASAPVQDHVLDLLMSLCAFIPDATAFDFLYHVFCEFLPTTTGAPTTGAPPGPPSGISAPQAMSFTQPENMPPEADPAYGLKCYSCDVNLHEECLTTTTCLGDEVCYSDVTKDVSGVLLFHSGCQKDCREYIVDDNIHQCCENDLCNNRVTVPAEHSARLPSGVAAASAQDHVLFLLRSLCQLIPDATAFDFLYHVVCEFLPTTTAAPGHPMMSYAQPDTMPQEADPTLGLNCYRCDADLNEECSTTVTCQQNEHCYADIIKDELGALRFRSGCQKNCMEYSDVDNIHQCCSDDLCNEKITLPDQHSVQSHAGTASDIGSHILDLLWSFCALIPSQPAFAFLYHISCTFLPTTMGPPTAPPANGQPADSIMSPGSLTCLSCSSETHGGCTKSRQCEVGEMCFGLKQLVRGGARFSYGCMRDCRDTKNLISVGVCCDSDNCNKEIDFPFLAIELSYSRGFNPADVIVNHKTGQVGVFSPASSSELNISNLQPCLTSPLDCSGRAVSYSCSTSARLTCYSCSSNVEGGCTETQECGKDEMCYGMHYKNGRFNRQYRYGCRKECTNSIGPYASRQCCNTNLCNKEMSFRISDRSAPLHCLRCEVGSLEDCKTIEKCKVYQHSCYIDLHDTVEDGPRYHLGCKRYCKEGVDLEKNKTLACCDTPLCNGNILPPTLRPPVVGIPQEPNEASITTEALTTEKEAIPSTKSANHIYNKTESTVPSETQGVSYSSATDQTVSESTTFKTKPTAVQEELTISEGQMSTTTTSGSVLSTTVAQTVPTLLLTTVEVCEDHELCTLLFPGLGDCSDPIISEHCKVSCGHCNHVSSTVVPNSVSQETTTNPTTKFSVPTHTDVTTATIKVQPSRNNTDTTPTTNPTTTVSVNKPVHTPTTEIQSRGNNTITNPTTVDNNVATTQDHAYASTSASIQIADKDVTSDAMPKNATEQTITTASVKQEPITSPKAKVTTTSIPDLSTTKPSEKTTEMKRENSVTFQSQSPSTDASFTSINLELLSTTEQTLTLGSQTESKQTQSYKTSSAQMPGTSFQTDGKNLTQTNTPTTIQQGPITPTNSPVSTTVVTDLPVTKSDILLKSNPIVTTKKNDTLEPMTTSPPIKMDTSTKMSTTSIVQIEVSSASATTTGDGQFIEDGDNLPEYCNQPDIPDCSDPSVVCDSFTLPFCPHKCGAC